MNMKHHRTLTASACLALAVTAVAQEAGKAPDLKAEAEALLQSADAVAQKVEELRGWKFLRPVPKAVRTKTELKEFLERMFAKEYANGKLERTEAWLHLLGLMPPGVDFYATMTDVLMSQIGGFYDPETKAFYMMAEAASLGAVTNEVMIAHELCHALDDQYVDLEHMMHPMDHELTEDESYVIGGVVEGSATALMYVYLGKAMQDPEVKKEMAASAKQQMEQQKEQMQTLLQAPLYCTLLVANYTVGNHFITRGKGGGMALLSSTDTGAAIREVAKDPPRSSEQLLHPEKYWDPAARDEPVLLADEDAVAAAVTAATGARIVERNTLGELVCAVLAVSRDKKFSIAGTIKADGFTNKSATGWGGDRSFLVASAAVEAGKPVADAGLVWITAWDTLKDREEFVTALVRHRGKEPGCDVATAGRAAAFAFGSARKLGEAGLLALLGKCRFTQDGKDWRADE